MSKYKFRVGDTVRVITRGSTWFDKTGVVAEIVPDWPYEFFVDLDDGGQLAFGKSELILAESDAVTEAQRKMQDKINYSVHKAERARGSLGIIPEVQWEAAKEAMKDGAAGFKKNLADSVEQDAHDDHAAPTLSADDKLRMIADTVAANNAGFVAKMDAAAKRIAQTTRMPDQYLKTDAHGNHDDAVEHPAHYGGDTTYETIKVIEAWGLGFGIGNCVKYLSRAGKKGAAVEDLKKARFYLQREIDRMESDA